MCLICIEWQRRKMTKLEVDRALAEMITDESSDEDLIHAQEVLEKVNNEKI